MHTKRPFAVATSERISIEFGRNLGFLWEGLPCSWMDSQCIPNAFLNHFGRISIAFRMDFQCIWDGYIMHFEWISNAFWMGFQLMLDGFQCTLNRVRMIFQLVCNGFGRICQSSSNGCSMALICFPITFQWLLSWFREDSKGMLYQSRLIFNGCTMDIWRVFNGHWAGFQKISKAFPMEFWLILNAFSMEFWLLFNAFSMEFGLISNACSQEFGLVFNTFQVELGLISNAFSMESAWIVNSFPMEFGLIVNTRSM